MTPPLQGLRAHHRVIEHRHERESSRRVREAQPQDRVCVRIRRQGPDLAHKTSLAGAKYGAGVKRKGMARASEGNEQLLCSFAGKASEVKNCSWPRRLHLR